MNRWMKGLNGHSSVAELSIPGTHDSAAYKAGDSSWVGGWLNPANWVSGPWWKCQEMTIKEQLDSGIRYFDLRIRYFIEQGTGDMFHFHHGHVYLGNPKDDLRIFKKFLQDNPHQFLILQIQQEHSQLNWSDFGNKLLNWLYFLPIFNYKNSIPIVGQLRGKVWLIQAAKVEMDQFKIDTNEPIQQVKEKPSYIMQNAWQDIYKGKALNKINGMISVLERPKSSNRMKINYVSCEPGSKGCHNEGFSKLIENYNHIGIAIMDYPPPRSNQKNHQKKWNQLLILIPFENILDFS